MRRANSAKSWRVFTACASCAAVWNGRLCLAPVVDGEDLARVSLSGTYTIQLHAVSARITARRCSLSSCC